MVAVAPEARAETGSIWLDDFLADWQTGTGAARQATPPHTPAVNCEARCRGR